MRPRLLAICLLAAPLGGCLHVTMDVNAKVDVNVRMEREVASLVSDIYGDSSTVKIPNSSNSPNK